MSITLSPAGVGDVIRWLASKAAVALGDIGMDTTTGRPSAFVHGAAHALSLQSAFVAMLSLETFKRQGVNAPPEGSIVNGALVIGGLQFDTTARQLGFTARIPANLIVNGSITLDIVCALMAVETAGDTIEFTVEYIAIQNSAAAFANGDGGSCATKAVTTLAISLPVVAGTGSAGLQIGVEYHVPVVLAYNDATNPFDPSQDVVLSGQITRTTVGGAGKVGNVLLLGMHFEYGGE